MSRKEIHMIRSHRSRSGYKPTNKTILNKGTTTMSKKETNDERTGDKG